jgi:IclR family acetate operon transcriptional repressor
MTIVDPNVMEAELAEVRRNGYALDRGERFARGRAMAVPVLGSEGKPLMAMMCVGKMELTPEFVASLSEDMKGVANDMSEQLTVLGDMPRVSVDFARYNFE